MQKFLEIFSPLKNVSTRTTQIIIIVQLLMFILIWSTCNFEFLPGPAQVARAFVSLWSNDGLGQELLTSMLVNLEAIGGSLLVSLGLAYLSVLPAVNPIIAVVSKLRFLSMAGLTFFFTIMTSGAHQLKIALLVFSMSVFFVTSMVDVINTIPKEEFDLARTLRMSDWHILWEVIILGRADAAFDVLRQNAAIGWMMLTMVEGMARSEGGIGALLLNQNKYFKLEAVAAIQITILVLGLGQDYLIGVLKNVACPYARLKLEKK